jgi:glycosyltransferase involved in cell wall biosynthesis
VAEKQFRKIHSHDNPYFLVLGRKTASKGYEHVIRAHKALRRVCADVDLILIGPDEDGRRIDGPGLHYLGRQSREVVRGALGSCLGLVTMSQSESFGIVICEAWLFGKPVIANLACYSFRDLVRHGETGLLVTTEGELTEAMRQLAAHPHERSRMGHAGFQEVITKFTWERAADLFFKAIMPATISKTKSSSTSLVNLQVQ